jgi:hypothetical protein
VTHLLLKALPHNCIATTIGKNSRIVIWYFNQSVGHLIANQCFRNRPPNPILLASLIVQMFPLYLVRRDISN